MPGYELDGRQRADLRDAVSRGFTRETLDEVLRDNNLYSNDVSQDSVFNNRISSLIDVFFREGRLIELCGALAAARVNNEPLHAVIIRVQQWLMDQERRHTPEIPKLRIVLSSIETDSAWKENFRSKGGFFDVLAPFNDVDNIDIIDTLDRIKQSKANSAGVLRDIDDIPLFVAIVSRRYIKYPQTATEIERAFSRLLPGPDGRPPKRRVLALALDQESRGWLAQKLTNGFNAACQSCVIVEEFFVGNIRKSIHANGVTDDAVVEQIQTVAEQLRDYFDAGDDGHASVSSLLAPMGLLDAKPDVESPDVTPGAIIILGEPKNASPPDAVRAADELAKELAGRNMLPKRWGDGWRGTNKPISEISSRPVFVRAILDKSQSSANDAASRLSSELNVAFGYQFDDESDNVRPLSNCPKVLWRPGGPDWAPPAAGPLLYSNTDQPAEFGRWLEKLLGRSLEGSAIVHYEDPSAKGDQDNSIRRQVVEGCLLSAVTNEEPPLQPDAAPFGYDQLLDVINSVGKDTLTVIAAHDLRTPPGSKEATIERFREIDRRIDQTLASKRVENAPLMRIAVLLRNANLFPALEFSRNSRVRDWQLLRIFKGADGTYKPDEANLERLREYAVDLARRRPELRVS
jgi:hypothetical protein